MTIYEMAKKEWPLHLPDDDFKQKAYRASKRKAYLQGGYDVLKEIESAIDPMIQNTDGRILDEDSVFYDGNVADIYNKIKELKEK